ncbi:hypothetical protein QVD17_27390 [Tagetes erecta]|uniref:Uncharacterized protein n=1 Tax=Tagetes erecta TaxID=13708 RepID=A0AAD8NRB6_TARER|nr:hypothetical protein QVD17_27390 [Tagetes erecta]
MEGLIPFLLHTVKKQRPHHSYRSLSVVSTRSYHVLDGVDAKVERSSYRRTRSEFKSRNVDFLDRRSGFGCLPQSKSYKRNSNSYKVSKREMLSSLGPEAVNAITARHALVSARSAVPLVISQIHTLPSTTRARKLAFVFASSTVVLVLAQVHTFVVATCDVFVFQNVAKLIIFVAVVCQSRVLVLG